MRISDWSSDVCSSDLFGGTLVLERNFAFPAAALHRIAAERVTGFPIVPTMLAMMLRLDLSKFDLAGLRSVSNTGAALPVEPIQRPRGLLPHVPVFSLHCLTECKPSSYLPPHPIATPPPSTRMDMPTPDPHPYDYAAPTLERP